MSDERVTVRDRLRGGKVEGRTDRYAFFLLLLIVDVVLLLLIPAREYGLILVAPFIMGTLLLGLYTSDARPRTMRAAAIAGVVVIVAAIVAVVTGQPRFSGLVWLMLAALLVATPWSILRHIFSVRTVTLRTIFGAVSVYILIGLSFAFVELGTQGLLGTFFAQSGTHGPADFVYFSYIAMATVGFGDLTPASGIPRALVVPEVIIGQVFLVTTVARLVSMYGMPQFNPITGTTVAAGDRDQDPTG
jgi:hypothetical protein